MSQKLFISEFDVLIVEVDFLPIGPRFKTRYCQPIIGPIRLIIIKWFKGLIERILPGKIRLAGGFLCEKHMENIVDNYAD